MCFCFGLHLEYEIIDFLLESENLLKGYNCFAWLDQHFLAICFELTKQENKGVK